MSILKNILMATDFSPASGHAVHYACDLAKEAQAQLHILNVQKDEQDSVQRARTLERLGRVVDTRSEFELDTTKKVIYGDPGTEIVNYVRDNQIDLVVMGTHGRTGLAHLTMGSVAETVLKNSPCPVTVLGPHDGENATCSNAVEVIERQITAGVSKNKAESRGQLLTALVNELRIPSTTAILLLDELESRKWLEWENESWKVLTGSELLGALEPIETQRSSDTQAIDIIKRACKLRATDIHVDPNGDVEFVVRFRIDGRLREYCRLDRAVGEHLINQCKALAQIEQADPFHAKEGRIQLPQHMKSVEVRLTSVPVPEGQAITLRILDPQKVFLPLGNLGFSESALQSVKEMLRQNEGLILITGPTGSGKTTTVYSMLETIGGSEQNIVSIEDPVEFMAPFVRQISVDAKHDLTMARGLRMLLRMDPDVLFIGEIRDQEAAEIAMRAAGSGKYVFSTLHTRDVASTVTSLQNLGIETNAIASNVVGIVNQRLVRRLCEHCKVAAEISDDQRAVFASENLEAPAMIFEPVGCEHCAGTGHHGRVGVFEVANIDGALRSSAQASDTHEGSETQIPDPNITSLSADALSKVADGVISFADATAIRWLA